MQKFTLGTVTFAVELPPASQLYRFMWKLRRQFGNDDHLDDLAKSAFGLASFARVEGKAPWPPREAFGEDVVGWGDAVADTLTAAGAGINEIIHAWNRVEELVAEVFVPREEELTEQADFSSAPVARS